MSWWNLDLKPSKEVVPASPGEIVPCDDPQKVIVVPKDPEPDLSTKPKDVIGYCFGYVCPKKHVNQTFDSITVAGYTERRACQKCGSLSRPAIVKRIAESRWGDVSYSMLGIDIPPRRGWYNIINSPLGMRYSPHAQKDTLWTKHTLVRFLDTPVRKKK